MAEPLRYRDLVRPSMVDTGIVQDNAGLAASRLADAFKDVESLGLEIGGNLRAQKGALEGAEAGEEMAEAEYWHKVLPENMRGEKPASKLRSGIASLTRYGQAYNNAATRSYAVLMEADADAQAARVEAESANDPDRFRAVFGKAREESLKNAQPELRAITAEIYNRRLGAGVTRLTAAQATEIRQEQRATTMEGALRAIDKIAELRASDDPALVAEAEEEDLKLSMLLRSGVADGTLSKTEGDALLLDTQRAITKGTVLARFNREFDNPYGDPVGFIEKVREANKTNESLPPDEEAKLMDAMLADLGERNRLRSARRQAQDDEVALRFMKGEKAATAELLSGQLTQRRLLEMVNSDDLDPAIARTLLNELQAGDPGTSNGEELNHVETNLLKFTPEEIRSNSALSWTDRTRLMLKRDEEAAGWKGTQQAKEGGDRIDRALDIVPGISSKMLTPEESRQRDTALTEWYTAVDALPPEERQAKAIEVAEQITERVIRSKARNDVTRIRSRMQAIEAEAVRKYGSVDKMSKKNREAHETEMKRQADLLKQAEAKAK